MSVRGHSSRTTFPSNISIKRIIFEACPRIVGTAVIVQRALSPSSFPPRRKATAAGKSKSQRTYVRSVPLRGGEDTTTDSVASKGVSFRVVFNTGRSRQVLFIHVVSTRVRTYATCWERQTTRTYRRRYRREDAFVAPRCWCSSRPNRAALAGWVIENRVRNPAD